MLAVQTEHQDVTRLDAFRDMLVDRLNDDGRRFDWTGDERYREWMRQALDSIERRQAGDS